MIKKTGLFLLLLLPAVLFAQDNWILVVKNNGGSLYYDPNSIKTAGKINKVWTLQDRTTQDPSGYLSAKFTYRSYC